MKIAVVGAGLTGLVSAYQLSSQVQIDLFESTPGFGGFLRTFRPSSWPWPLEIFYHHFFHSDRALLALFQDLKISSRLKFYRPKTSSFYNSRFHQLDSPLSVLRFTPLSFFSRLRLGAGIALVKFLPYFSLFDSVSAIKASNLIFGSQATKIIWQPLLKGKFAKDFSQVSFSWLWARLKSRTAVLGYPSGGFSLLTNSLLKNIKKQKANLYPSSPVEKIISQGQKHFLKVKDKTFGPYDAVLLSTPYPKSLELLSPQIYPPLKYLGALTLILELSRPALPDNIYWLNIHDSSAPFLVAVEQNNLFSSSNSPLPSKRHLLYLGGYYPASHPYYRLNSSQILEKFWPYLQKISPQLKRTDICQTHLFTAPYAQPLTAVNHRPQVPTPRTSRPFIYWANMSHIFPWDRGLNYSVLQALKTVKIIREDLKLS